MDFWHQLMPKKLTVSMGSVIIKMNKTREFKRIESEIDVKTYLDRLKYALDSGSVTFKIQKHRKIDKNRDNKYTNSYTIGKLFPNEDVVEVLGKELSLLTIEDYIETVKDTKRPKKSEMRVFGKKYSGEDVYIKIRVALASQFDYGGNFIFVMSFHYAEWDFKENNFPYIKV